MAFVLPPPNTDFCPWLAEVLVPSALLPLLPKEVRNELPPKGDEPVPVFAGAAFIFPKENLEGSLFCSSDPEEEAEGLSVAADVPKVNLGVVVAAAVGVVEVMLAEAAGVVGVLKLNIEALLVVFCGSEPKAPVSDEEEAEGRAVVEAAAGEF